MKNDTREALLRPLFAQALSGDKRAYEKLLNEIAGFARNYVRRRLASPTDHDDVVQEILLSVHKALHTYDPRSVPADDRNASYRRQPPG